MRILLYFMLALGFIACNTTDKNGKTASTTVSSDNIDTKATLDALVVKSKQYLDEVAKDTFAIPRTAENGKMVGKKSKSWTSGFYAGLLWKLYGHSKDEKIKEAAQFWSAAVEKEKYDEGTHDLGFKIYCPFGSAYDITHIADAHATTTLNNHFRPDNSSYHVVSYDPITGAPDVKHTHQGLNHESDWSRGQAWGLHGYTATYRYTKDPKYLEQAKKIAEFIFTHPNLPADKVPYWDYDAPNIPNEPRDVSAAAITASGLLELATYDTANTDKYNAWADEILVSLGSDKYKCDIAPFFLKHSVGSIPGEFEMDAPIIYADYFYVEALLRKYNQKN